MPASRFTLSSPRWRDCFSDEHYFATLLATQGRDAESDCQGNLVNTDWSRGGAHPRAYTLREISAARHVPRQQLVPHQQLDLWKLKLTGQTMLASHGALNHRPQTFAMCSR